MRTHSTDRIDSDRGRHYRIRFSRSDHDLYVEEVILPSVTHILGSVLARSYLTNWSLKLCTEHIQKSLLGHQSLSSEELQNILSEGRNRHLLVQAESARLGSETHALMEARLRGGSVPPLVGADPRVRRSFLALNAWWEKQRMKPVEIENTVFSIKYSYAGTMDLLANGEAGICLVDWKTTGRIYKGQVSPTYLLQAVSYARAVSELRGIAVSEIHIVVAGRDDGRLAVRRIDAEEQERLFQVFLSVRHIYDWLFG